MSNSTIAPKYDAFISYSRADKAFAAALEKALEAYRPPKDIGLPRRNLNIFRDEGDLIGNEYYEAIDANLQNSAKLIVVCSPNARSSAYVNDEISRFAEIRRSRDLIPILLEGIPNNEGDKQSAADMAFPQALCDALEMPLATHYKGFRPGKTRVNRGIFEGSWFTILANLYGIGRDVLEQREKKRKIRRRRLLTIAISTVMAVILAMAIIAWIQKLEADRQRFTAQKQLSLNYWDNGRRENASGNFFLGQHLKAAAVTTSPDPNLSSAIIQNTDPGLNAAMLRSVHPIADTEVLFACNGKGYVLTEEKETKRFQLIDAESGTPFGHALRVDLPPDAIATRFRTGCSPVRMYISVLGSHKTGGGSINRYDFESGQTLSQPIETGMFPIDIAKDLKRYLIRGSDNTYRVRAIDDGGDIGTPIKMAQGGWAHLSDNGKYLVVSGHDKIIRIFDIQTGLQYQQDFIQNNGGFASLALSPGCEYLATWGGRTLSIWNFLRRTKIDPISVTHEHHIRGAMFFKHKSLLLIWDTSLNAHILNPINGEILIRNISHSLGTPIISPDEQLVLTFTKEGGHLWETRSGQRLGGLFHPPIPRAVFLNGGNDLIALGKDHVLRTWDLSYLRNRYRSVRPTGGITAMQWGSSQQLLTLSRWAIERWDVENGERLEEILSRRTPADGFLHSSQTHRTLVWGKKLGRAYFASLTDKNDNRLPLQIKNEIETALLSPDQSRLFIRKTDGTAGLWNFNSGQMIARVAVQDQKIGGGVFSKSGRYLLVWTEKGKAALWDTRTAFDEAAPFSPDFPVRGAVWSARHNYLLTWNPDGLVTLWKQPVEQSGKLTFRHGGEIKGVVLSEKSERIITWTADGILHFFDMHGNEATLPAKGAISGISLSPDQKRVLIWSTVFPAQAVLWDVASGREIIRYPHKQLRGCLGFSADQKFIVTYDNREARIWQLPGDLDFPSSAFRLKSEAFTGTYLHTLSNTVRLLPRDKWLTIRQKYIDLDREHAKTCAFRHQNDFLNFFQTELLPSSSPEN